MAFTQRQVQIIQEKRPDLRFQPIPDLDDLIIEFLKKYDVDVKPTTSKSKSIRDNLIGGAVTGMAGIDAGGDVFIASGQEKQTKVQEWTQWKQWALNHKDFEEFKKQRLEENQFFNKSILEKINTSPLKEELENILKKYLVLEKTQAKKREFSILSNIQMK